MTRARPKIVESIVDTLRDCHRVCVVGHVRPDGDCIGSQLGLALALGDAGKSVSVWNEDRVPDKLRFLDSGKLVRRPAAGQDFDAVIATDCATLARLGSVAQHIESRRVFINIDHHASNTRYGDLNWVVEEAPSTGELIYQLCRWARWKITRRIADCLFTAVSTDTGSFQYPSTRPATLHAAAELVRRGADLGRICHEVYQSYPLSRVRLLRHVYTKFRLTHANQTAYFWLRQVDYTRAGADCQESEGLIDHIRAIESVVVAIVFEEVNPELTRISLRSKSDAVDVNEIAAQFGGGGHKAAAGARVPGRPLTVQRQVLAAVKRALKRV